MGYAKYNAPDRLRQPWKPVLCFSITLREPIGLERGIRGKLEMMIQPRGAGDSIG